jgi:hypothetical protein
MQFVHCMHRVNLVLRRDSACHSTVPGSTPVGLKQSWKWQGHNINYVVLFHLNALPSSIAYPAVVETG